MPEPECSSQADVYKSLLMSEYVEQRANREMPVYTESQVATEQALQISPLILSKMAPNPQYFRNLVKL